METDLTFGQWLKRRRRGLGLSQRALGERLAYSSETIRKVEADELRPSRQLAERLADALDVQPGERARFVAFARDEATTDAAALPTQTVQFPSAPLPHAQRHNLPAPLTTFVGRESEVAELRRQLGLRRLVTLTAAGGMGKSRLALEVASGLIPDYAHGVWLVEFAALSDPARVAQAVARVLGVSETTGQPVLEALTAYVRDKALLLLLDNCEHLIDAVAALVVALIQAGPAVRILANSREALAVDGEVEYAVPALAVPPANGHPPAAAHLMDYEAVQLFLDRATLALPSFALTPANAAAVAQVCRAVEGMPLAIELAAARVKLLQVEQIANRLADRFSLLRRESRSAPPRHLTLQATIDWSHALLPLQEQVVLRRAAVFAGGWTLEAAEAVCAIEGLEPDEILDLLSALVRKSMVWVEREAGRPARYRLLETIREYALARLTESGEWEVARARHAEFFLQFAEEAEQYVHHAQQALWLDRLRLELNNLRAAIEWYEDRAGDPLRRARLVSSLWCFCILHGHWTEGIRWLEQAIAALGPPSATVAPEAGIVRGRLHIRAGLVLMCAGQTARADELASEGLALCRELGTPDDRAEAMFVKAYTSLQYAGSDSAESLFTDALSLAQAAGDRWYEAASHSLLGSIAFEHGRPDEAEQRWLIALEIDRELQDEVAQGDNLGSLASLAQWRGRHGDALALRDRQVEHYRRMGVRRNIAGALWDRGSLALGMGDFDRARQDLGEALQLCREQGQLQWVAGVLIELAALARREGSYAEAETLLHESFTMETGSRRANQSQSAAEFHLFGILARARGDAAQAAELLRQALRAWPGDLGGRQGTAASLWELGILLAGSSQAYPAVRLLSAAAAIRSHLDHALMPIDQADQDHALAGLSANLGETAIAEAWAAGAALALDNAVTVALEITETLIVGPHVPVLAGAP